MESASTILVYIFVFISLYFQVFLLATFFEKRSVMALEENGALKLRRYPSVTIVVPCFNEERTVSKTLFSLLKLDYPKNKLDIFIVDDGSTDNTWSVVNRFKKWKNVTLFKKVNGGKYTALNHALLSAKTELIGCLDADSFVEQDTLKKIVKYFEDGTVMAVTPAIKIENPRKILELIQNVEYGLGIFYRKMLGSIDAIQVTPGPFSIFRKKVFDDLGPYRHAHNTEDLEIAFRMHESHYRIVNAHKAFVRTVAPKTLRGLYKQRLRWVHGFLENSLDYKHLFFNKKYGNFGMLMLPAAVISIFSALYLVGFVLKSFGNYVVDKTVEAKIVGASVMFPSLDWFFFSTDAIVFLSIVLITMALFMILAGKKIAEDPKRFNLDIVYFMLCYGFIVPLWLFMAVYNTIFSRRTSWR
ncbi:MAG: glycosyltransferase family 2 protein [Patescibacteria group bacterium]